MKCKHFALGFGMTALLLSGGSQFPSVQAQDNLATLKQIEQPGTPIQTYRYLIRQNPLSLVGSAAVRDAKSGKIVLRLQGRLININDRLEFKTPDGTTICYVEKKLLSLRDTVEIKDADGKRIARVQRRIISPFRRRYRLINDVGPGNLDIDGDFLNFEYVMTPEGGGRKVATISKRPRLLGPAGYEVEIAAIRGVPSGYNVMIIATTVAVGMLEAEAPK